MLPHIHPKDRYITPSHWILVLCRSDVQASLGPPSANQPSPATTLDTEQLGVEGLHKGSLGSPAGGDGIPQRRCCAGQVVARRAGGSQVLPEERMVDVATAVELDLLLNGDQG